MVSFICFTKLLFTLHLCSLCIWDYILLKPKLHIFYHFISKCFSHEGTNFIRKLSLTNAQEWILFSYLNYLHGKAKHKFFLSRLNKLVHNLGRIQLEIIQPKPLLFLGFLIFSINIKVFATINIFFTFSNILTIRDLLPHSIGPFVL